MEVESLFKQFEDQNSDTNISAFKDSVNFFNLVTRYAKHLNKRGMIFKNIYFRDKKKPYFDKKRSKKSTILSMKTTN